MTDQTRALIGGGLAILWSLALLTGAALFVTLPVFALIPTIMTAFLAPGLVMIMMVGRVAQRRFNESNNGQSPLSEGGEIDRSVLQNTMEQMVLAAAIWPAAAVVLGPYGPGVIVSLGVGFAFARLIFWVGYHRGLLLRAFGFGATFYPTVFVALWSLATLVL